MRREQESVLDLTIGSSRIIDRIQQWEVLEEETLNWHRMICFEATPAKKQRACDSVSRTKGWKITPDTLPLLVRRGTEKGAPPSAGSFTSCVRRACNESFPKKKGLGGNRHLTYWWTAEIGAMRREAYKLGRSSPERTEGVHQQRKCKSGTSIKRRELA